MSLPSRQPVWWCTGVLFFILALGCNPPSFDETDTEAPGEDDAGTVTQTDVREVDLSEVACDDLDPFACSLPWPSNLYLKSDESRESGYELDFRPESLPANADGKHVDPEPFRRLDGYGVGTPIMAQFPNVDASEFASRYDVAPSVVSDAPIVLLEVQDDGETRRVPYWTELDIKAKRTPEEQILIVRPGEILKKDTRYVVAFRNLKKKDGSPIRASESFAKLRDGRVSENKNTPLAQRKARFEEVFDILESEGISRRSLTLAWDFHTASRETLLGPVMQMREHAVETLGEQGPEINVEEVTELAKPGETNEEIQFSDEYIKYEIDGTIEIPQYTKDGGENGDWVLNFDSDYNVQQNGTRTVEFTMGVPHTAVEQNEPLPVVLVGPIIYAQFGWIHQFEWPRILAESFGYITVSTNWSGVAGGERGMAISAAQDLSTFPAIADRLQEGILEFVLLGRAAKHRLGELDPLKSEGIAVDDDVYFLGIVLGGVFGLDVLTLSKVIDRAYLHLTSNNFSTILERSDDFGQFIGLFSKSYESRPAQLIGIAAAQLLWAPTDPVTYAEHVKKKPLHPDAAKKDYIGTVVKADPGLPSVSSETLARSGFGIPLMRPYDEDYEPWGVPMAKYPHVGSGLTLYDLGTEWPTNANLPPVQPNGFQGVATDHLFKDGAKDGKAPRGTKQLDHFFQTGQIVDACDGEPCGFEWSGKK